MNVKDFVSATLVQIIEGVREAQVKAEKDGASINSSFAGGRGGGHKVQTVEFDIAITASEQAETEGGLRVVGIGGSGSSTTREESVSRVRFTVPVTLPTDHS